jgi:hypothetical protein
MNRRAFLTSLAAFAAAPRVIERPPVSLEWLCAAVKIGAPGSGPFTGSLYFEPVTLDQTPFEWPLSAQNWNEAFAESGRMRDWFAAQGYPSWSVGTKGPWNA